MGGGTRAARVVTRATPCVAGAAFQKRTGACGAKVPAKMGLLWHGYDSIHPGRVPGGDLKAVRGRPEGAAPVVLAVVVARWRGVVPLTVPP